MKVLIIYAHPNPKSFNKAIVDEITKGLTDGGHQAEVLDLYGTNFNPTYGMADFAPYMGGPLPQDVQEHQAKVGAADALVFVYPVWWSGFPAILKGWVDRVLTIGFAFKFDEKGIEGLLKHRKAVFVNTAMAPAEFFTHTGVKDAMTKIMVDETMKTCGVPDVDHIFLYNVMASDDLRKGYLEQMYNLGKGF